MSRVGKKPIPVSANTKITYKDRVITVQGEKGSLTRTINPNDRMLGLVSDVFSLGLHEEGWVEVICPQPVGGMALIHGDSPSQNAWGLVGVAGQPSSTDLYFSHYDAKMRWWTVFALANLNDAPQTPTLEGYDERGHTVFTASPNIPGRGRDTQNVRDLFVTP